MVPKNGLTGHRSSLLEAGQKETLSFTAPKEAGNYDYLCTYPEHFKTMFGELVVVPDVAAYLEHPTAVHTSWRPGSRNINISDPPDGD